MSTRIPALELAAMACARAEFAQWDAIITERETQVAAIEADATAMFKRMSINEVALEIAQRLRISERQVWSIVEQGTRLRDRSPAVWAAFAIGVIGAQKASVIAAAIGRSREPETAGRIDKVAIDYATGHTPEELKRWLNKLLDRLEPVKIDEAEAARAQRCVKVDHTEQGMSYLSAYIPSIAAVAIDNRLTKAAQAMDDEDDDRTRQQKRADLFASWLTNATGTETDIKAEIAVVVEAEALAGATDTPASIGDDGAVAPIPWMFGVAESESTLWTRLLTDPAGHVLDVTHLGYQPPEALRKAIRWRDMRCRVAGCSRLSEFTDIDHRKPWDQGGPTNGPNLWCLCRKHHGMKGHGLLPASAFAPPAVHLVRLPSSPLVIEYVPAA